MVRTGLFGGVANQRKHRDDCRSARGKAVLCLECSASPPGEKSYGIRSGRLVRVPKARTDPHNYVWCRRRRPNYCNKCKSKQSGYIVASRKSERQFRANLSTQKNTRPHVTSDELLAVGNLRVYIVILGVAPNVVPPHKPCATSIQKEPSMSSRIAVLKGASCPDRTSTASDGDLLQRTACVTCKPEPRAGSWRRDSPW